MNFLSYAIIFFLLITVCVLGILYAKELSKAEKNKRQTNKSTLSDHQYNIHYTEDIDDIYDSAHQEKNFIVILTGEKCSRCRILIPKFLESFDSVNKEMYLVDDIYIVDHKKDVNRFNSKYPHFKVYPGVIVNLKNKRYLYKLSIERMNQQNIREDMMLAVKEGENEFMIKK